MAPKRKLPSGDDGNLGMPKTIVFGRSRHHLNDINLLKQNKMVIAGRAPGSEVVPKSKDNEIVIFCNLLYAVLRFELDPVIIDILHLYDIYLHLLTPNALVHLSVYMWICKTTKIKPSAAGFASAHKVHLQPKYLLEESANGVVEKKSHFGCLNFMYRIGVVSRVAAYCNKWPIDWHQHWLYHEVESEEDGEVNHLVTDKIEALHQDYKVDLPPCLEGDDFIWMLRLFARKYSTCDIIEEYCKLGVWPVRRGWRIPDSCWTDAEGSIPCPDWSKCFKITKEHINPVKIEEHGHFILSAESPSEYEDA
uniref:Transposase (putative) gypsy type domain-containing protein n=1 Tax=Setaria italica TaxID=4555 RepID=K4AM69_SETIT